MCWTRLDMIMSLPGHRLPTESMPAGSSTPAQDADALPVYCRHGVRWTWVPEAGGYLCDDPQHYMDEFAEVTPGATPADHQPHFANPPNEAQQRALEVEDILEEREAVLDRIDALRRGN